MTVLPASIRGRLLLGLIVVVVGMNAALLASSYAAARHEINELFDAQLAQSARVLQGLLAAGNSASALALRESLQRNGWRGASDTREGDEATPAGHEYESKLAFQLLDEHGELQARTRSAPLTPLSDARRGYDSITIGQHEWRVFVLPLEDSGTTLQVGQRIDIRGELEGKIAWKTVQKSLYGLPLLALLVWLIVGAGLRPLARLTDTIGERDESQLGPLGLRAMPTELRPIVSALDSLFTRLRGAWARERRFLDEAAHELRTPLAAIQLHAESLANEIDPEAREHTLERLIDASNRGSRLASQLLTLARVESNEARAVLQPVALAPLLRAEAALLAPLAAREDKSIELQAPAGLADVRAEPGLLALMVRNLVDNAIRHSPSGGTVRIAAAAAGDRVVLTIEDEGPGIPRDVRERAMARFSRLNPEGGGSGLGLAICSRIAEQHDSQLELLDGADGRGLRVRVRLARA